MFVLKDSSFFLTRLQVVSGGDSYNYNDMKLKVSILFEKLLLKRTSLSLSFSTKSEGKRSEYKCLTWGSFTKIHGMIIIVISISFSLES